MQTQNITFQSTLLAGESSFGGGLRERSLRRARSFLTQSGTGYVVGPRRGFPAPLHPFISPLPTIPCRFFFMHIFLYKNVEGNKREKGYG